MESASDGNAYSRRLTVFGATGDTGRLIVQLAVARGQRVTVLVRDRSKLGGLTEVVEGSVLDAAAVDRAIPRGTDAVLSALGQTRGSPADLETVALANIVQSMRKNGVKRLVVLANTAIGDPRDDPTASQRLFRWLAKVFRRSTYNDSLTKGPVVRNSGLDWTIVRTSLLTNSSPKGRVRVGVLGRGTGVRVSRNDMAEFMLNCAVQGRYIGESPYISE
ncbi:MAG TPA: NAD(P)H-binding protein [Nitrososphaerales archaeon]|nr:NAD(P)H-binding protein [Nitrososphaerales archaeon]